MIFEDQLAALEADSKKVGTQGGELDFALLVDGLAAEREQGITIDVAYRFFSTDRRKFIVADTPGHEQYTRNMVTGASTADVAVILIDARKGVLTQTRRHSYIVSLLGIRHVVLAINKMDLVDYSQQTFDAHRRASIASSRSRSASTNIVAIPLSALQRRQHARAQRAHAVVPRPDADGATSNRVEIEDDLQQQAVPAAGAVGESPEPGFPRLRRHDRERRGSQRRHRPRAAVRAAEPRRAHRHARRRSATRPSPASRSR